MRIAFRSLLYIDRLKYLRVRTRRNPEKLFLSWGLHSFVGWCWEPRRSISGRLRVHLCFCFYELFTVIHEVIVVKVWRGPSSTRSSWNLITTNNSVCTRTLETSHNSLSCHGSSFFFRSDGHIKTPMLLYLKQFLYKPIWICRLDCKILLASFCCKKRIQRRGCCCWSTTVVGLLDYTT